MRGVIYLLIFVMLLSSASAYNYISGEMDVQSSGETLIEVETNADIDLGERTDTLTVKNGNIWAFQLNSDITFDQVNLRVCLPKNIENVGRIESDMAYRIDFSKRTCVEFTDFNSKLDIKIPYTLKKESGNAGNFLIGGIIIVLLGLAVLAALYFFKFRKKKNGFSDIQYLVNENEMKILDALMKGEMRQKELRKKLDFPKASFSRYIYNLEKKRLIVRKGFGKNKIVSLK